MTIRPPHSVKNIPRRTVLASMVLASLLGSACSTTGGGNSNDPIASYNSAFSRGDYATAITAIPAPAANDESKETSPERDVFRLLHVAEAQRLSGDYRGAIASYEQAEAGLKKLDLESGLEKGLESAASFVGPASAQDYEPYEAEKILINTYKALAFLSLGEANDARVEFNRVNYRSQRAMQSFESEIASANSKKLKLGDKEFSAKDLIPEGMTSQFENKTIEGDSFAGYEGFMLPASTYLHGIYNLASADRDLDAASHSLRQLNDMYPEISLFKNELSSAESGSPLASQLVWVVYENGTGPSLVEQRADVDATLDISSMKFGVREDSVDPTEWRNSIQAQNMTPYVISLAIPTATESKPVEPPFKISTHDAHDVSLTTFSSMTSVSNAEIERRKPAMLTKAFGSSAVKVAAQALAANAAEKKGSGFGAFAARGMGIATAKATSADTRSWSSIPAHWEVARFERPADGVMKVETGSVNGELSLPSWSRVLVYVKRPSADTPLRVSLIDLNGQEPAIETTF
ncbi:COG3014 family protein [Granulosicoccus antarcticus]|uniref:Lipoprotein n=1 Tax=Granulosicoccus antarcticus IMCC3135 TaxID=1192854 RepID=A0A2Z2P249_9GAMM|nr:hypothetical protein [Granulosicoccus antarcticus]ASJ76661.1 hypothetical protein IMCC3135_33085 [Granulosicoccus antarcticus IMCC3135]